MSLCMTHDLRLLRKMRFFAARPRQLSRCFYTNMKYDKLITYLSVHIADYCINRRNNILIDPALALPQEISKSEITYTSKILLGCSESSRPFEKVLKFSVKFIFND